MTRIEKDSLGEIEIPSEAYYGVQTQRARDHAPTTRRRARHHFARRRHHDISIAIHAGGGDEPGAGWQDARRIALFAARNPELPGPRLEAVVGPGPDAEDERARHRSRSLGGDLWQGDDEAVVVLGEEPHRVLQLALERHRRESRGVIIWSVLTIRSAFQ